DQLVELARRSVRDDPAQIPAQLLGALAVSRGGGVGGGAERAGGHRSGQRLDGSPAGCEAEIDHPRTQVARDHPLASSERFDCRHTVASRCATVIVDAATSTQTAMS